MSKSKRRQPPTVRIQLTKSGAKEIARRLGISERDLRGAVRRQKNPLARGHIERRGSRIVLVLK